MLDIKKARLSGWVSVQPDIRSAEHTVSIVSDQPGIRSAGYLFSRYPVSRVSGQPDYLVHLLTIM